MLNGARFLWLVVENSQIKGRMAYKMSVPTMSLKNVSFHGMILMSREAGMKKLNIHRCASNNKLVGTLV